MTDTTTQGPFAGLQPGDYIEIHAKPWRGSVHRVTPDGRIYAVDEQAVDPIAQTTAWESSVVEKVTVLRRRPELPTELGSEFVGCVTAGTPEVWVVLKDGLGQLLYVPVLSGRSAIRAEEAALAGLHVTGEIRTPLTVPAPDGAQ